MSQKNSPVGSTPGRWLLLIGGIVASLFAIVWGIQHPTYEAVDVTPHAATMSPSAKATVVPARPTASKPTHNAPAPDRPDQGIMACRQQTNRPFVPTSAELFGVGRYQAVPFGMVRDGSTVQLPVPPDDNPSIFAVVSSDRAALDDAMIRLTAHTWYDGRGLGNVLIDKAKIGSVMILRGSQPSQVACYRIHDREQVTVVESASLAQKTRASQVLNRFNGTEPRDDLAVMVCAGTRISAGNYPDRLNLFASRYR